MVFGWLLEPEDPGEADHPLELEPPEEDFAEELEEPEPDVEELPAAVTVVVLAARAAIEPARPRNVAALSTPATTRERFAAWRRLRRGAGRRAGIRARSGAPSRRNPGVGSMSSPRSPAVTEGRLDPE